MGEIENDPDLQEIAEGMAGQARAYLTTTTQVAAGAVPGAALPLLLLALSDVLAAGARLGAVGDVVPVERFEPDPGPDTDLDPLRTAFTRLFDGFDDYVEVTDPLVGPEIGAASLSGDLACVAECLAKGLQHYETGRELEGLWWWQFSYVSLWGERAASGLRVLQSALAHLRLDVEDDVATEAEYDALQT
ncbi:DUF5063 domain-containing protein [Cellulosimicrobium arenosum]|uniref:DUF5063 domain-containing protein n=1 Tax=Cellulosimicrobium arenosum TaxID=2708133 RepID=A0A927J0T8_9MICO|nr:DUF5063 domain-containing protein [Cellulosimicrobium arenosum]MBD8079722.1 DUF5063 domain-containing protein [Cellulosimicrobium arenosum]